MLVGVFLFNWGKINCLWWSPDFPRNNIQGRRRPQITSDQKSLTLAAHFLRAGESCFLRCFRFGPHGVKSSSVTWGWLCTFACLAVCMKYANEIFKEVLWEHFSSRFSKYTWLPEVLMLWFFPFRGYSFSRAGLLRVCERWGLSESNAFFIFSGYIFLVHKSVTPANGRLAEVAPGWLATFAWSPSHTDR